MNIQNQYYGFLKKNTKEKSEFSGLNQEVTYWFPRSCKYLTWSFTMTAAILSISFLILYGGSFGHYKICIWLLGVILTFLAAAFLLDPIQIVLCASLNALLCKFKTTVTNTEIYSIGLSNDHDIAKRKEIENERKYNALLYVPTPSYKLKGRFIDIRQNIQLRTLVCSLFIYVLSVMSVYFVISINRCNMGYHNVNTVKDLIVSARYTNSMPFTSVNTYDTLLQYLNKTFLPALMVTKESHYQLWQADVVNKKRNTPSKDGRRTEGALKTFDLKFYEKGWTLEPAIKLIGPPRIRQLRVSTDSCEQSLKLLGRNLLCAQELTWFNEEKRNFKIAWDASHGTGVTPWQASPWQYQTARKSGTLPMVAKFFIYPGGGYVLNLANSLNDSLLLLHYMDSFQWIDIQTRVVGTPYFIFIEFTAYCVNTNDFVMVTLLAERSATGYLRTTYQIDSHKLMLISQELWFFWIVLTVLLLFLLLGYLFREGLRIYRVSFNLYVRSLFTIGNMSIIICGLLTVSCILIKLHCVNLLLHDLNESFNHQFISFSYIAFWCTWANNMSAITVLLLSFKIYSLLAYKVQIYKFRKLIVKCFKQYLSFLGPLLILLCAFALFFNLVLWQQGPEFTSFTRSLITLFGIAARVDDAVNTKTIFNTLLQQVFYFLFFILVYCVVCINIFLVVGCVFFHAVENGSFVNEFRLGSYIKSLLTKESTDLFKSKGEKVDALLKELNASTLRLRGGGNQKSKLLSNDEYEMKKMGTQKKKSKNKLFYQEDTNILNRYVSELKSEWNYESCSRMKSEGFVKKKLHDLTEYRSISTDRMTLMKALATAELGRAEENKLSARKTALILLFLHLTSWDKTNKIRKMNKRNKSSLEYVRVTEHGNEQVVLARRIHDMERVVGDFVRTKSAQAATKDNNSIDVFGLLNKLFMLNENIEFLLRNKK